LNASPLCNDKERGSSSTTTSVPMAAPSCTRLQVQTTWTYLTYLQYLKFSDYQGVSVKIQNFFAIYVCSKMFRSTYVLGCWCAAHGLHPGLSSALVDGWRM
jgi:hypothetical protein